MVRLNPAPFVIRMASWEATGTVPSIVPVVACPQALPEMPMMAEPTATATALRCKALLRCNRRKDALFTIRTPLGWVSGKVQPLLVLFASAQVRDPTIMHVADKPHAPWYRGYSPVIANHQ